MIKLIFVVLYIVGAHCSRHTLLFNHKLGVSVKQTIDKNTKRWIRNKSFKACEELKNWPKNHKKIWKTYEREDFKTKYPNTFTWITTGDIDAPRLNEKIETLYSIDTKTGQMKDDPPELEQLKKDIEGNKYNIQVVNSWGVVKVNIAVENWDPFTIFEASKEYLDSKIFIEST